MIVRRAAAKIQSAVVQLIVQKTDKLWGVIAGGRRRAALMHLVNDPEAKGWTMRTKVRCRALPDDTAAATAIT